MRFKRQGDFYNITGADAKVVARELGLTVLREGNLPLCGVPAHRLEQSVRELNDKGYGVEILSPKDWNDETTS